MWNNHGGPSRHGRLEELEVTTVRKTSFGPRALPALRAQSSNTHPTAPEFIDDVGARCLCDNGKTSTGFEGEVQAFANVGDKFVELTQNLLRRHQAEVIRLRPQDYLAL